MQRAVELHVGGQRYRVVSSASSEELERLAKVVDDKIAALVPPGRPITPQSVLLAALALAHDLEEERQRSSALASEAQTAIERIVGRVDAALASVDETISGAPSERRTSDHEERPARSPRSPVSQSAHPGEPSES